MRPKLADGATYGPFDGRPSPPRGGWPQPSPLPREGYDAPMTDLLGRDLVISQRRTSTHRAPSAVGSFSIGASTSAIWSDSPFAPGR